MSLLKDDDFGCRPPEPFLCNPDQESQIAIGNGISLRDEVFRLAQHWSGEYHFTPDLVCDFNAIALNGIYASAGKYRDRYCARPDLCSPRHSEIPRLVAEMCEFVNPLRDRPFYAAAYLLCRTKWIHPFYDGNSRVSRALGHLAILVETGDTWKVPLPELFDANSVEYEDALDEAHKDWDGEIPRVAKLQAFIAGLYAENTTL